MSEQKHLENGRLWIERNRPEKAEPELRKAIASDPEDAECYAFLALCLVQLDREKEAITEAERAIGLDPEWDLPYSVLASALAGLGKWRQAEQRILEAIELDPEESSYYGHLSLIYGGQKKWRKALEAAENGLELDPEDEQCINARASALIQLGETEDADLALESSLARDPEDSETHSLMGWSMLHRGEPDKAIEHYTEALKLDPQSDMARAGLVEAIKSKNFIYRAFLKWVLLLTRIETRYVFMILIGTVVLRMALRSIAEKAPAIAPIIWPVYYLIIAFILLTWVAVPIFNLMLRLHPVGKHALTRKDIRQTNWLVGSILVVLVFVALWLSGSPGMGMAAVLSAFLILPLMTTLRANSAKILLTLGAYTLALAIIGGAAVYYERNSAVFYPEYDSLEEERQRLNALPKTEAIPEKLAFIEKRKMYDEKWGEVKALKKTAFSLVTYFLYAWVAFTWVSGFVLAKDEPD